jgi:hypothetical protein
VFLLCRSPGVVPGGWRGRAGGAGLEVVLVPWCWARGGAAVQVGQWAGSTAPLRYVAVRTVKT